MRFLFTAIFLAAMITFGLRFFGQPTLNVPVTKTLVTVSEITAKDIVAAVKTPRDDVRATLLYVYTSWCPFCKMQHSAVEKLAREQGPNGLQVIGLSFDDEQEKIEEYLSRRGKSAFTTFRVEQKQEVANFLNGSGASFTGGIPYIALFNREGKLLAEYQGMTGFDTIEKDVAPLLPGDRYRLVK